MTKEVGAEGIKLKKIMEYLDRGELTHGLALFKDFKMMNKEIALRTDKLFGEILETEIANNEEATLFLKRLKTGQSKLALELKKSRLEPSHSNDEKKILKKAKDKIQYWKFEGDQLWKVASQAARKTIAIIDQVTSTWKTLPIPVLEEDEEEKEPEVMAYVRRLAEGIHGDE